MESWYDEPGLQVWHGDCIEAMRELPESSVDSIVTDPPYGLGFMGKDWDDLPPGLPWAQECLRVLKPGGHLLAFGGTRTWHRLACAVEDAGFEMRDSIAWVYGQGFPKSSNVGKSPLFCQCSEADWAHGSGGPQAEHDVHHVLGGDVPPPVRAASGAGPLLLSSLPQQGAPGDRPVPTEGAPDGAEPGMEGRRDVQAAEGQLRRPEVRTVSARVAEHGAGGWLRDGAPSSDGAVGRPTATSDGVREPREPRPEGQPQGEPRPVAVERSTQDGRGWPVCARCGKQCAVGLGTALKPAFEPVVVARKPLTGTVASNVLAHGTGALNIDGCRVEGVVGHRSSGGYNGSPVYGDSAGVTGRTYDQGRWPANVVLDESQAAALDQQSGTSRSGVQTKPVGRGGIWTTQDGEAPAEPQYGDTGGASRFFYVAKAPKSERPTADGEAHPTVKPLTLMRWLVRLVTPPGGTVLDPFGGSGTTAEAAMLEGFGVIIVERHEPYLPLIVQRIVRASTAREAR